MLGMPISPSSSARALTAQPFNTEATALVRGIGVVAAAVAGAAEGLGERRRQGDRASNAVVERWRTERSAWTVAGGLPADCG